MSNTWLKSVEQNGCCLDCCTFICRTGGRPSLLWHLHMKKLMWNISYSLHGSHFNLYCSPSGCFVALTLQRPLQIMLHILFRWPSFPLMYCRNVILILVKFLKISFQLPKLMYILLTLCLRRLTGSWLKISKHWRMFC